MQENYKNRPAFIIGLSILFFILLSFIPGDIQVGPFQLKPIDLFIDIKPDSLISVNSKSGKQVSPGISYELNKTALINLDLFNSLIGESFASVLLPDNTSDQKLSGNVAQMKQFFVSLKNAGNNLVRIAHYGDSEIEGDLISADIRQNLQNKFGGMGAGFLSITSQDIAFRTSTKHSFSDNWNTISVFSGNPKNIPIGIDGSVSTPKGKAWVNYETTGRFKNLRSFNKVRIFYNTQVKQGTSAINYNFDNKKELSASLKNSSQVNEHVLNSGGESKSFKLTANSNSLNLFGVSLESGNGVYLDNFPLRGNSGVSIRDFSPQILKEFNKLLNYKLIILSFGLNIASSNLNDYTWYEKEMIKVVNLLKSSFPQASILIVSVGDKGIKKGTSFITDPNIPKLVDAQRYIALKSGVAFWNLYEAMGGQNSMGQWVNAKPPLAFKDYTHVNLQGAEKIAGLLTAALLEEYKKYN